jgi:glycosyltransferase involved in cell wall biosynthesis
VKISVITPTHLKNAFITELYHSLRTQTYENWEWVLFLNGGATSDQIDDYVKSDSRVKVFTSEDPNTNIGFNKNKAFHLATGEVLVEMDHDDLLTTDCLEELVKAYQENPDAGFVYSDDAMWFPDKEDLNQFTKECGWTARVVEWEGKKLIAHDSFPPTSRSMSFIWYAPDHIRSWRTSFYKSIGGHNPELSVCDDHELLIRTYLNTKMHHIPKVLYIYRITGQNSFLLRNQQIQETTVELFKKYAWDLNLVVVLIQNLDATLTLIWKMETLSGI